MKRETNRYYLINSGELTYSQNTLMMTMLAKTLFFRSRLVEAED